MVTAKEYEARLRLGGEHPLGPNFYWKVQFNIGSKHRMHAFRILAGPDRAGLSLCGRVSKAATKTLQVGHRAAGGPCLLCLKSLEKEEALR